jgi:hypothetical protein
MGEEQGVPLECLIQVHNREFRERGDLKFSELVLVDQKLLTGKHLLQEVHAAARQWRRTLVDYSILKRRKALRPINYLDK